MHPHPFILRSLIFIIIYEVAISVCVPIERQPEAFADDDDSMKGDECFPTTSNPDEVCASFWGNKTPPVILISLDGFRPEYLSRSFPGSNGFSIAPTIKCLAKKGVHAPSMMPSFPTVTFPNHYTIVTGLYPESHGIVGNSFYDPTLKATFNIHKPNHNNPMWWKNGQNIWTTMKKESKISAMHMWPGANVQHKPELMPNYWFSYNKSITFKERVDQVLKWMELPFNQRPDLTTLYFEEPDSAAHKYGPNSHNVTEKLLKVDTQLRRMIDEMIARNIFGCINLIIVSDHGMAENKWAINMEDYIPDLKKSTITFHGTLTSLRPMNSSTGELERLGKAVECRNKHMRIFTKWDLPYRLHSLHSNRIPGLMLDVDLSWRTFFRNDPFENGGSHGWDNLYQDMQAIFVAYGPSFKSNYVSQPFENIQLYNLMCALVNVTPAANNGTWGALHHLLTNPPVTDVKENVGEMPQILHIDDDYDLVAYDSRQDMCNNLNDYVQTDAPTQKYANEKSYDSFNNFNMTKEVENQLLNTHAPSGVPMLSPTEQSRMIKNTSNYGLLVNKDYLTGYNIEEGIPLWTAYTINKFANVPGTNNNSWRSDPRLRIGGCNHLTDFTESDSTYIHIFPKEFARCEEEAWLDTNLIQLPSKASQLIQTMNELVKETASRFDSINVITGLTHHHSAAVFYVISTCVATDENQWDLTTCPIKQRRLQAFLLPVEMRFNQNCMDNYEFIAFHVASLSDIERVTKFNFFPDLPYDDKLDLLTRTILSSELVIDPCRYSTSNV